jgi:hypothetical protein
MLGILYRGTKIEANTWNSVPNHSTIPQRRKRLGIPFRGTKIVANSRNSIPKHVSEQDFW